MITAGLTKAILYVKDMGQEIDFYCNKLDLKIKHPAGLKDYSQEPWVEFDTGQCTLILHCNGDKQLGVDRAKLAFHVDDIDSAYQALSDRGVKLSPIRVPSPGLKIAEGIDPEGNPFTIDCQK